MFYKSTEMTTVKKENRHGGPGVVTITSLGELAPHTTLLARVDLGPGDGIGEHQHVDETEFFYVIEGELEFTDNGSVFNASAGDALFTGNGGYHSVKNVSAKPASFFAGIVTQV